MSAQATKKWPINYKQALVIMAALAFNNWLLGLIFNRQLLFKGGSVSELSAAAQPHAWLFRSLDILAGGLFIILAYLLARAMRRINRRYLVLPLSVAGFGIANMVDALLPLKCSETLNPSCVVPVNISLSHFTIPSHGYSSVAIGLGYLLLPIFGYVYAQIFRLKRLKLISLACILIAVASIISVVTYYFVTGSFSEKAWGPSQEIQMAFIGVWLVILAMSIFIPTRPS